ncbi:MAG: polymer-forming cytoskeletal protein [Pseudomonadota bacterium]
MFSKSKISDSATPGKDEGASASPAASGASPVSQKVEPSATTGTPSFQAKPKPSPSLLSNDLNIKGNVTSSGDIQIEGTIEGDVRAHLLTVGESATIRGEVIADDVVVNGRVIGRVRGLKVRLTSSARVEGDIVHKTIAIESGAHFEGSVQRQEDPLGASGDRKPVKVAAEPAYADGEDA